MGILDRLLNKTAPLEPVELTFTSGTSPWREMKFTKKPMELPTESTKDKGEVEDIGLPNYEAIDALAKYDTMIDGTVNVKLSAILSAGYRLVGKNPSNIDDLRRKMHRIEFDQILPQLLDYFLRYGNCFGNLVMEGGDISQIQLLPPHNVKIGLKGKKFYQYRDSDGEDIDIDWRDMLHFKARSTKDYAYGRSDYDSSLELLEDYARFNEQFRIMVEDTVAPMVHTRVGGDDIMTRPSPESLKEVAEAVTNAKKAGIDITTDKLVEIVYVQADRGFNFAPLLQWFRGKILVGAMVAETKMMLRSDAAEGGDSLHQVNASNDWIMYLQKFHLETIFNFHLIPMLMGVEIFDDDGVRQEVDYDDLPRIEFNPPYDFKLRELNYLLKQYNVTLIDDEIREKLGLPPFTPEERKIILNSQMSGKDFGSERPDMSDSDGGSESSQVRVDEEQGA